MPFCSHTGIFTSVYSPGATAEEKKLVPSYEDIFDPCEIPVFAPLKGVRGLMRHSDVPHFHLG